MNSNTNLTIDKIVNSVQFSKIDYGIISLVLLISFLIGIYFGMPSRRSHTVDEYLYGDHKMNSIPVAFALIASQLSLSITTIPAEIYAYGWSVLFGFLGLILFAIATNYIFLPILYQNGLDNCYTYLEVRFGKLARNINIVAFIINQLLFLPVILFVTSSIFAEAIELNVHIVNGIVSFVCIFYTILGGMAAIIWTQLFQGAVMICTILIVATFGINEIGLSEIWNRSIIGGRIHVPDFSIDLTTRITFWNITISTFLMWIAHVTFNQNSIQRIASVATLAAAKRTMFIFLIGIVTVMVVNCGLGLIIYAYFHRCDPIELRFISNHDQLISHFINDIAGHIPGITGCFIASMICATLTIVSSSLHTVSGILYNDWIRPNQYFVHTNVRANRTMQTIVFLFGVYCWIGGILVQQFSTIFQILNTVIGMTTGAKFGVFTLGLFYPWTNINGLLSGTVFSMFLVFCLIVNTQYHIAHGIFNHRPIPTAIDGCTNETLSLIQNSFPNQTTLIDPVMEFTFYKISPHWYTLIGFIAVWIPAVLISYMTGGKDFNDVNFQLLAPCVRKFIPKRYRHTKLKVINVTNGQK